MFWKEIENVPSFMSRVGKGEGAFMGQEWGLTLASTSHMPSDWGLLTPSSVQGLGCLPWHTR